MKKTLALFVFILLAFACQAQQPDCAKFENGSFVYPTLPGKVSVRKQSVQESYNNGNLEMIWKVKWLSSCEYEMTCQKVLVNNIPVKKGDKIVTTIIATEGDCYTYTSILYNADYPKGFKTPASQLCLQKK
jgi:hypothetical protein